MFVSICLIYVDGLILWCYLALLFSYPTELFSHLAPRVEKRGVLTLAKLPSACRIYEKKIVWNSYTEVAQRDYRNHI